MTTSLFNGICQFVNLHLMSNLTTFASFKIQMSVQQHNFENGF